MAFEAMKEYFLIVDLFSQLHLYYAKRIRK